MSLLKGLLQPQVMGFLEGLPEPMKFKLLLNGGDFAEPGRCNHSRSFSGSLRGCDTGNHDAENHPNQCLVPEVV